MRKHYGCMGIGKPDEGRWGEGGILRFFKGEQEGAAALIILVDAQCKGDDGRTATYSSRAQSRAAEDGEGARAEALTSVAVAKRGRSREALGLRSGCK